MKRVKLEKIDTIQNLLNKNLLEPYIRHIRFPSYKNISNNLKIDLSFPITALVGQNGTNKSSILKALYGSPDGYNVGNFWFSTEVDPITDNRARFIYGYKNDKYGKIVEVIKSRINKVGNPDYWEPSRPLAQDNMEKMPDDLNIPGRSKTRWNAIKKEVVYIDFRSEISAFDKFFYHGDLKQTLTINTKQDFIRNKSRKLNTVINNELKTLQLYKGKLEHVLMNENLPKEQVEAISRILGRDYTSIRLIKHRLFKNEGYTAIIQSKDLKYSEAFAGSGEFAVIQLVNKISIAPERSLIILDEPEVSLHPGAQERLVSFMYDSVKTKKHQFVIGTHSPAIVNELPPSAIKILHIEYPSGKVLQAACNSTHEAFFHLEQSEISKKIVYTEDKLAKEILDKSLSLISEAATEIFNVRFYPGGASALIQRFIVNHALTKDKNAYFFLDGDQNKNVELPDKIINLNHKELKELTQSYFGVAIDVPCDGSADGGNIRQLESGLRDVLEFSQTNVFYLPGKNPERFIIDALESGELSVDELETAGFDEKKCFEMYAKRLLSKKEFQSISSEDIFFAQKVALAKLPESSFEPIKKLLLEIMQRD